MACGYNHSLSLFFLIKGHNEGWSGFQIGNRYIVAIFDKNYKLVNTHNIFIGKIGYIGAYGGLHKTSMNKSDIQSYELIYLNIKINVEEIGKIIISHSK